MGFACKRIAGLPIALACLSLSLAGPVAGATAQAPDSIDELVDGMLQTQGLVHPPGDKDIVDNFDVFRLGWALWDTGEGQAGYCGLVEQLNDHDPVNFPVCTEANLGLCKACGSGVPVLTLDDIRGADGVYEYLFNREWSEFDLTVDLPRAMEDGVNLLTTQNTIYSPQRTGSVVGSYSAYDGLESITSHSLFQAAGAKISQNIGFASQGFPIGEYDFNIAHPMVKVTYNASLQTLGTTPVCLASPLGLVDNVNGEGCSGIDGCLTFTQLNMAHAPVAEGVAESIVNRVEAYAATPEVVDYLSVGGEYVPIPKLFGLEPVQIACTLCPDEPLPNEPTCMDQYAAQLQLSPEDYSEASFQHFREWLELRYGDLASLETFWYADFTNPPSVDCASIGDCSQINPIAAPGFVDCASLDSGLTQILWDWTCFQRDQRFDMDAFQYNAAKAADVSSATPGQPVYTFEYGPQQAERGALRSDGTSMVSHYPNNSGRSQLLTKMKRNVLHANTYGEAMNFPLFAMPPLPNSPGPCMDCNTLTDTSAWPDPFKPFCLDAPFTERTLWEFVAGGVDSVGLAYFENGNFLNLVDAEFGTDACGTPPTSDQNLLQVLGPQVDAIQTDRLFMSPWRTPLLVYTGEQSSLHGMFPLDDNGNPIFEGQIIEALAQAQVQFAAFSLQEGFEDLWLTAEREVMLIPMRDLDAGMLDYYRGIATDAGLDLVIMTDYDQEFIDLESGLETCYPTGWAGGGAFKMITLDDPLGQDFGSCPQTGVGCDDGELTHRIYAFLNTTPALVRAVTKLWVLPYDIETAGRPAVRPVRALNGSGNLFDTLDVTVSCDGINFLVSVGNPTSSDVVVDLEVVLPAGAGDYATVSSLTVPEHGGIIQYIPMTFPEHDIPSLGNDLTQAVAAAASELAFLESQGFDTRAGEQLHALLAAIDPDSTTGHPDKVLAGLLRLERMPFVRLNEVLGRVTVRGLDYSLIGGAKVQLEFVLQKHYRRNAGPCDPFVTGASGPSLGIVVVDTDRPPVSQWDFSTSGFAMPSMNVVEAYALHPEYGTEGMAWKTVEIERR